MASGSTDVLPAMRRTKFLAPLLVGLASLIVIPTADAYELIGGRHWPGRTITYYNASPGYALSVKTATAAWNASGMRTRFVSVSRARARVIVHIGNTQGNLGLAILSYAWGPTGKIVMTRGRVALVRGMNRYLAVKVIVHEFGHVLGLDHEGDVCAAMNAPTGESGGYRCKAQLVPECATQTSGDCGQVVFWQ